MRPQCRDGAIRIGAAKLDRQGALEQRFEWGVGHEPSPVDDHDPFCHFGQLGQQVARHQDGPTLGGQPAQEVADPAHARRVETVGRFVEDEDRWVTE